MTQMLCNQQLSRCSEKYDVEKRRPLLCVCVSIKFNTSLWTHVCLYLRKGTRVFQPMRGVNWMRVLYDGWSFMYVYNKNIFTYVVLVYVY